MKDPYKTLEVEKNADEKEIKKAYRKKAGETHPDKKTGDKEAFMEVNTAYMILANPLTRREYDQTGDVKEKKDVNAGAWDYIIQKFQEAIRSIISNGGDICNISPIAVLYDIMDEDIRGTTDSIHKAQKGIKLVEKIKKRLKCKNEDGDPLTNSLNEDILNLDRVIKDNEQKKEAINKAKLLLEVYSYKVDDFEFGRGSINRNPWNMTRGFSFDTRSR